MTEILFECREDIMACDLDENGRSLRPHVVFYGETPWNLDEALAATREADVLIVVGSTLEVGPANQVVFKTGARDIYVVDPNPPKEALRKLSYSTNRTLHYVAKQASDGVPIVIAALQKICKTSNTTFDPNNLKNKERI